MISLRLIFHTSLCVVITFKIEGLAAATEDLVDEYYTTLLKPNDNYLPQDEKDAQAIVDSKLKKEVIAGILSYRDKIRRFAIHQRVLTKIDPMVTEIDQHAPPSTSQKFGKPTYVRHQWPSKWYQTQRDGPMMNPFMDLCFGLLEDENVVISQYLNNFFPGQVETWIIIAMVLTKDMGAMISAYDAYHSETSFKKQRKSQHSPFENMLRVWVRQNREPIEPAEPNFDAVKKDADNLVAEYGKGTWHEKCRDQLELILMKKSIKYARAVIKEFEKAIGDRKLEDIINESVNNTIKLNPVLAETYSSLALYIKDKYNYMASILGKYNDSWDQWACWILCIAVARPQEWSKIDQAFQAQNKGQSLSNFILKKLTSDQVMAEMIAVIIDPKFKPTTFSGKPNQP